MRGSSGLVMLVRCGCVVGHTAQGACVFSRKWHGLCQERPGVPHEGAAVGFPCRKAGDGWDIGGYRSRFCLDLTAPDCMYVSLKLNGECGGIF